MRQFNVTGMSCAACQSRVEKAVGKVPGVASCAVSLLTNSMGVEGTALDSDIIKAVEDAGYGATAKSELSTTSNAVLQNDELLKDKETPKLAKRLVASSVFLAVLMYFSMGHSMFSLPIPKWFDDNFVAIGLLQMLLAAIVMVINQKFFINGFKGLWNRSPNMDTLVALGSMASFVWSVSVLFAMTKAMSIGDNKTVIAFSKDFYFESAATILTLITVGKMLEAYSKGKTTDALKSLMRLAPKSAVILVDSKEMVVPVEKVKKGDLFVVKPGENIPVDGIIIKGNCAVDESALTGESVPVDKAEGDAVSAATINQSGYIVCEATRVGEDTTLSQIIRMVNDAAATKAPIAKVADEVSGVFVPVVIGISLITFVVWLLLGKELSFALARAISVLVISCPCSLGLATPVAIMVGNGMGAKNGILFKTAVSLEETGKIQIVALDKTGTITNGEPLVTDLILADKFSEKELLSLAGSLESKSEHPLSKAIMGKVAEKNIAVADVDDFIALPGKGLSGKIGDVEVLGGSLKFVSAQMTVSEDLLRKSEMLAAQGKTPLLFAKGGRVIGIIAVADTVKEDSSKAVKELHNLGIRVVMLTGDNEKTAKAIASQVGIDNVIAGVLPDGKDAVIKELAESGKVAMVGDGINDAPALTRANVGIAIGAGTDVAIDAADIVLMKSRLSDVSAAIRLSRQTLKNVRENLFWAFFYNVIGIPLAAGVWIPLFGWTLSPMFGAAAMSLSSFCVVANALRLNWFDMQDSTKDRPLKGKLLLPDSKTNELSENNEDKTTKKEQEHVSMKKTMKIEGMMCGHCEARVKKTLEGIEGVTSAEVSHTEGTAIVSMNKNVENEVLKNAVEAQDYKVVAIN